MHLRFVAPSQSLAQHWQPSAVLLVPRATPPQRAMGYKGDAGRYSPKGIALNLFSLCVFVTPIILTTRGFQEWDWLWKVNVGMFLVMFATPPWGWKKPHPYSDQRHLRSRGTQPGPW